jgi:hypothetical protein
MTLERTLGRRLLDGVRPSFRCSAASRARRRSAVLVLTAVVLVAAACTTGPAVPTSSPASPTPLAAADAAGFAAAVCMANSEMLIGFGNPESGISSVAWKAFETAVQARDPARIDAAAAAILPHFEAARAANDRGATWAPGAAASAENSIVLAQLTKYLVTVRDARGEPGVVAQAAKDLEATWPHLLTYWQMLLEMMKSKAIPITQLPC